MASIVASPTLKRFKCCRCHNTFMVTGGTTGFVCDSCRAAKGETPAQRLQRAAHKAVADAVRRGALVHPSAKRCTDCTVGATEYDHRDYNAPLVVEPVCRRCNLARGPAIGSPAYRPSQ